jgi:hypothetical protein
MQISRSRAGGKEEIRSGLLSKKLKWESHLWYQAPSTPFLPVSPAKRMKFWAASSQAGWERESSRPYLFSKISMSRTKGGFDLRLRGLIFLRGRVFALRRIVCKLSWREVGKNDIYLNHSGVGGNHK